MAETAPFCTPEGNRRIEAAIAAAERETSGEIAVMVVEASDRYRDAEILGAVLLSGFSSFVACVAAGYTTLWSYIPLTTLLFFPWRLLLKKFPRFKRPLVSPRRLAAEVRQRAVRAFFEKGLYRTRRENGILVFVSLLERKVWILADRGIDACIPHQEWQEMADEVSRGIRDGRGCEAVCEAVTKCGSRLREHFPRLPRK